MDPLIYHGFMKVGWGHSILSGISSIYSSISSWPTSVPVLLLHGSEDTITPITDSKYIFEEIPQPTSKTFIEYPGVRHELFHEHNKLVRRKIIFYVLFLIN